MGTDSVNNSRNCGNGDGDSENAWQTYPNSTSDGVVLISTPNPSKSSSYANVTRKPSRTKVNFCTLFTPAGNGIDVVVLVDSMDGLHAMLENGPWFIRNNPLILKKWHPDVNLLKEDVGTVPVWVKLYDVPITMFSGDGSSAIATKLGAGETKNLKKPSQTLKGVPVGQKVRFKLAKQVYQPVSKKPTANTSENKKKNVEPTKEVSKSNPFDVLTSVENDVELGINGGTSNFASQEANSSGSSFWNVNYISQSTALIIEKIDKIEKLIIEGKVIFVDDEEKLLKKDLYGTNSLLKQWKESYENDNYDYDPYDDDMYEDLEFLDKLQSICDNLDIKASGGKKK
uniref:Zinc knuckle CX2CX4HX4C n=1 Tax=Tanacetum cinerariifolium TaxID=118510 RepID=A0A6L2NT67_TANCI|nr:zinc knuckle CX2CX4HX4C [Tanacetum cinerariifolium]